ncbi:MAG TPA: hypothetical protein VFO25_00330 [Candidatus Eremiobacteraceae bacterium]|nr:hypothetical protein [Candidatus Eremiobacteraceae bacterium]
MTADELTAALAGTDVEATMKSLGFTTEFVAKNVMSVDGPVTVAQVAMLWMGMPNKHDRKRTRQLLDALTTAGLLTNASEDTYLRK